MLIESIPNVSEGVRPHVLDAVASTVSAVPGAALLDRTADPSHNRSVFSIAGTRSGVRDAVLALAAEAVARIDLRAHHGQHPRIGAVDVIPFVPLQGATMADAVALAREVGRAIADRHGVPVFLYEEAATAPHRRRLEDIRRGQLDGLAARMARPEWLPDFGPTRPHPTAGATVVGARRALIAFNVNLATDRVDLAAAIARRVRESSGGLPCVKAIGLQMNDGTAQVSMNLTDYERTPIHVAYEAVTREAEALGVGVGRSELIGLIPAAALKDTSFDRLGLPPATRQHILEARLAAAGYSDSSSVS